MPDCQHDIQTFGGRYWVRTSDLFRVREARYHCANRPFLWLEVKTGFEPVYTALQAAASPLGHSTVCWCTERMTRLELATPTLARLCATNCATSACSVNRTRRLCHKFQRHVCFAQTLLKILAFPTWIFGVVAQLPVDCRVNASFFVRRFDSESDGLL